MAPGQSFDPQTEPSTVVISFSGGEGDVDSPQAYVRLLVMHILGRGPGRLGTPDDVDFEACRALRRLWMDGSLALDIDTPEHLASV